MTNPIIRAAHPAAPLTPQTQRHYAACRRIKRKLMQTTDAKERIQLIGEIGRLTQQIWNETRRGRAVC